MDGFEKNDCTTEPIAERIQEPVAEVAEEAVEVVAEPVEEVVEAVAESEAVVEEVPVAEVVEAVAESEEVIEAVPVEEAVVETVAEAETASVDATGTENVNPYVCVASNPYRTPEYNTTDAYNTTNAYNNTYAPYDNGTNAQGDGDGLCVAALVLGIVAFPFNPLYICSTLAIIFGIVGQCKKGPKAKMGMTGWILGICAIGVQIIVDAVITIFSAGIGSISICW